MKLMKRKWKGRKNTKGNMFYNCPYQHVLQVTKAKYEGDILLLPSDVSSSTCTKICHKPAPALRIHGSLLKEDIVYKLSVFATLLLPHSFMVEHRRWVPAVISSATNIT